MTKLKIKTQIKPKRKTMGIILGVLMVAFAVINFIEGYLKLHQTSQLLVPIFCLILGVLIFAVSFKKTSERVYDLGEVESYEIIQ